MLRQGFRDRALQPAREARSLALLSVLDLRHRRVAEDLEGALMGATPLTLRCPRCKKGRNWREHERTSAEGIEPTGRTKIIRRTSAGVLNVQAVEVRHVCGHVFWTTHPSGVRRVFPAGKYRGNASCSYIDAQPEQGEGP
jgi:hypothetical protein